MMMPWLVAGTAAVTLALCAILAHPRLGPRIMDRPGHRSLHERPTPRTGGVAMFAAVALGLGAAALLGQPAWRDGTVVGGTLLVITVSLLDDVRGLPVRMRLPVHTAGAVLLLWAGLAPAQVHLPGLDALPLGWAGGVLALLLVVWMTNLYNFMDGMDGFAGGMGVIGFGTLGLLGLRAGADAYALSALLLAGANLGFLALNFPPARIFMGDTGAVPMGFLAAALMLEGARGGIFPLWVGLLVFSPFVVDASLTLLRRAVRGERVWQAHRSHYYQRLVLLGWGHRKTTLSEYGMMLTAGGTALAAQELPPAGQVALLAGWCFIYAMVIVLVARLERTHRIRGS